PSNGMCIGVTPSGGAGRTRPSMRSATASAITSAASVSVPVGRCGPCCSMLPAGRVTSGLRLSCAAISGWGSSAKLRLGNMTAPGGEAGMRLAHHLGDARRLPLALERAQGGVDDGDGGVAVLRREFVRPAGAAAFGEHVELGTEHVAWRNDKRLAL